jgi:hypothetical protein
MTFTEVLTAYTSLTSQRKVYFLARLSYHLTVNVRGPEQPSKDIAIRFAQLTGANELQHSIIQELYHHHENNLKRYPDEVLLKTLREKAKYWKLDIEFSDAFRRTLAELTTA